MLDKLASRKIAARYAKALFDAAREQGQSDDVFDSMQAIGDIYTQVPELAGFFTNPAINLATRLELINGQFQPKVASIVHQLLLLLVQNDRMEILPDLVIVYNEIYHQHAGVVQANVTVPIELSKKLLKQLQQTLEKTFGYDRVDIETRVDPSIIAGAIVKIGDRLIDGSYRGKLNMLRKQVG